MASPPIFSSVSLFFLLFLQVITSKSTSTSAEVCPITNCSSSGPEIRFPFRIREVLGEHCGYEGFEISCDDQNRTILHLSEAGDFVVDTIDYADQYILVKDPNDCLPKRLLENKFMSSSSPFVAPDYKNFTLANCSSVNSSMIEPESGVVPFDCLNLAHHMVVVMVPDDDFAISWMLQHQCYLWTASIPWWWQHPTTISESILLRWFEPDCKSCEEAKGRCGLKGSKRGSELICIRKRGLSKAALITLVLFGTLAFSMYIDGGLWFLKAVLIVRDLHQNSSNSVPGSAPSNNVNGEAVEVAQRDAVGMVGISPPTIESYPRTQIDDLAQLAWPNDDVCVICLSRYEQKEMICTIPECKHYFHAYCIDRWLRENASCPLCRNYQGYTRTEVPGV